MNMRPSGTRSSACAVDPGRRSRSGGRPGEILSWRGPVRLADASAWPWRDCVLESAETTRPVFILGYSMGALVAFDYLCPRTSQLELPDDRHVDAIRALITVGSPLDFMRLYLPQYVANRQPRVQDLPWSNVSIPADVLGSNCTDVNDHIVPAPEQIVEVAGMKPSRIVQFTEEKLTWSGIRARRGFPRAQGEQKVLRPGRWIAVSTAAYAGDWAYVVFLSPHGGDNQLFPLLILGGGTAYLGVLIASMGAIINWQDRRSGRQPPRRPALA